ncbi:MAG: hypothetical protein ACI944_002091 [Natronomonas sp.]|jgi:hypothetical protein
MLNQPFDPLASGDAFVYGTRYYFATSSNNYHS